MAKQSSITGNVVKIGGQDVFADPKKGYVPVKQTQTVSNADNISYDPRTGKWGGVGSTGSKTTTTSTTDAQGNKVMEDVVDTQNYSVGGSSQKTVSSPGIASSIQSPLVKSIAPTDTKRIADGTDSGYMTEEEKKKRGIVDITQSVTPGFDGSTQKFQQGQLTEDQLRARYEADLASGASQDQLQREYGDMGAPKGMGEVGSQERMARQKQQAADKAIQNELSDLNRAGQIFDRGNEDLTMGKERSLEQNAIDVERAKEDRTFQLEELRKNVNRNIEDTGKQRDETMQAIRRQGAALGLNVVSTFQQSYKNTQDKFNNVINRMQEDLNTQEGRSTLEDQRLDADYSRATKQLLQDYEKESTRLKQDFEYTTRDYRENLILDANKLVEQYGLSSDKLGGRLQELALDAFNKVETAYGSYLDNSQKQVDLLDSQVNNVLDTRNKYLEQQKTYADNFLAGSQNLTIQDINAMVRDGQISEQMAQQTLGQVVQMALDTIDTATVDGVGVQFQDQIIEAINAGLTPMQAIQQVMASEEFAPVVEKMQELGLSSYQKALAQIQIAQGKQGLEQGRQEIDLNDVKLQQANQELLDTVIAKGGIEGIIAYSQNKRGKTELQCGELVNDYWQNITGSRAGMGDTYASKVSAIDKAGRASVPMEGGMFAMDIGPNGHTGIVMAVNPDGSIEVLEANAGGTKEGSAPTINTYSAATVKNMVFSQPPIGGNVSGKEPTPAELAMFDKGAQYIGKEGGLSQARYNEIANYKKANQDTTAQSSPYLQAFNLLSFSKPTLAEQEQVKIEQLISKGDTKGARIKLESLAKEGLGTEARNDYDATRTMVSSLDKVQATLDALKAKGVKTSLLKGKYEDLVNKFGTQSDPEIAKLGVTLKDQLDAIRRARSGAALTEFEEAFYDSIFPSNQSNYDLNTSKISGLRDSRKMLFDSYLEQAYGEDLVQNIWYGANNNVPTTAPVAQERGDFEKRTSLQSSPLFQLTK